MASGAPSSGAGNRAGSGSSPTQSIEPDVAQALASAVVEAQRQSSSGDGARRAEVGGLARPCRAAPPAAPPGGRRGSRRCAPRTPPGRPACSCRSRRRRRSRRSPSRRSPPPLIARSRALGRTVAVGLGRRRRRVAALRPRAVVEPPAGHVVDARVGVGLDRVAERAGAVDRRDPRRRRRSVDVRCRAASTASRAVDARSPTAATGGSPTPAAATTPAGRPSRLGVAPGRGPPHGDDEPTPRRGGRAA